MRSVVGMGVLVLVLGGCHGPLPAQRFGLEPVTDPGPYRNRLAPYKLRGEPRPGTTASTDRANPPRPRRPGRSATVPTRASVRPGNVRLRKHDLDPVRAWFSAGRNQVNTKFILADNVDIVASKEFFSQVLTANSQVGLVKKAETVVQGDRVITLSFVGERIGMIPSAMHSPRVLIGTGFTVTARQHLRVRLSRTQDASRPVRILINAQGDAAMGHKEDIWRKDDHQITVRGALTWDRSRRQWVWNCG